MERDFLHTLTLIKIRLQKISLKITYAIKKQSKQRIMRQERFVLLNQKIKYHHKKNIYLCEEHSEKQF